MKRANFLNLLLVSVLLAAAGGCKKTPKNITPIGAARTGAPGGDNTMGNPLGGNTLPPGSRIGDQNLTPGSSEIPGAFENANEDRAALSAQTVYFDFDRFSIKPSEQGKLDQVATYLKSNTGFQLRVEGHCDERGTEEYNRSLGERRAISAREYLIQKHQVSSGQITTVSFGEDKPVSLEKTEEAYAQNRRAEFVILKPR
jgi:peptidoglycan-associated lipoprotein